MDEATFLIIHKSPQKIINLLRKEFSFPLCIDVTNSGIEGLLKASALRGPIQIIVGASLSDLSGGSVSSILKHSDFGKDIIVYLVDIEKLVPDTTADAYYPLLDAVTIPLFLHQVVMDYKRISQADISDEEAAALEKQQAFLPTPISTKEISLRHLFSAFCNFSGDSCNYWMDDEGANVFGYLLDCTGHGLCSFTQVGALWFLLKKNLLAYQKATSGSLGNVMANVNQDIIDCYSLLNTASAIVFRIDIEQRVLFFSAAHIPFLLLRHKDEEVFQPIFIRSSLLGYEKDSIFKEEQIALHDVSDVVFLTDGLSSLLLAPGCGENLELFTAKDDDATAIWCQFNFS